MVVDGVNMDSESVEFIWLFQTAFVKLPLADNLVDPIQLQRSINFKRFDVAKSKNIKLRERMLYANTYECIYRTCFQTIL